PAYAIIRGAGKSGFVMSCMTIDEKYLANSAEKLGVELAIRDDKSGAEIKTPAFPTQALEQWKGTSDALVEIDGHAWAVKPFTPAVLETEKNRFSIVAALDVTRIRDVVQRNLLFTVGVLVVVAGIAIALGARLASIMSRALARVNAALKKLEKA